MLDSLERHCQVAGLGQLICEHGHDTLVQRGPESLDHFRWNKVPVNVRKGTRIVNNTARIVSHGKFSGSVLLHKLAVFLRNAICFLKL